MTRYIFILLFLLPLRSSSQNQHQYWEWAKSFGRGSGGGTVDIKTKNGYLYVAGNFASAHLNWDGAVLNNNGQADFFVAKLDTNGNTIWVKNFGGPGEDVVSQMEINSTGAFVLLGYSGSNILIAGPDTLVNPQTFFVTLDTSGNIVSGAVLPTGPSYTDIDIDNERGVYLAGNYSYPFNVTNNTFIDTANGYSGAVLLKYNSDGTYAWNKAFEVRENTNLGVYDVNGYFYYSLPYTGISFANMKIENNEWDSTIRVLCEFNRNIFFGNKSILYYDHAYERNWLNNYVDVRYKYSGAVYREDFISETDDVLKKNFETGKSGYTYTTGYTRTFLSQTEYNWIAKERDNIAVPGIGWYFMDYNNHSEPKIVDLEMPVVPDESGNYLMASWQNSFWSDTQFHRDGNIIVFDTTMKVRSVTDFEDNIYYNGITWYAKCMANTNAIFFAGNNPALLLNTQVPGFEINLPDSGIFVGKYSFKNCLPTVHTDTVMVCRGSDYTFPDGLTISSISAAISHTSRLHSLLGCDSLITTNIDIVSIDTSISRHLLEFRSNASPATYQWLDCAAGTTIASANNQLFSASSIGNYAVEVTKDGCADTSSCYPVATADLLAGARPIVSVYPVPATDHFTLMIQSETVSTLSLSLVDFSGRVVKTEKINLQFGKNSIRQNTSTLSPGTYRLLLKKDNSAEIITRVIVKI